MTKLETLPKVLLRAFKEEQYAIDFIDRGRFRLGNLASYCDNEDTARRDHSEGYGLYYDRQNHEWHSQRGDTIYILCCSTPEVDLEYLRKRMGQFVVRINDPRLFVQHTEDNLAAKGIRTFNGIHGRLIKYTKGTTIDQDLDGSERAELCVMQKPADYHRESEYRLFTILIHDPICPPQEFIEIDLEQSLQYAEMVP